MIRNPGGNIVDAVPDDKPAAFGGTVGANFGNREGAGLGRGRRLAHSVGRHCEKKNGEEEDISVARSEKKKDVHWRWQQQPTVRIWIHQVQQLGFLLHYGARGVSRGSLHSIRAHASGLLIWYYATASPGADAAAVVGTAAGALEAAAAMERAAWPMWARNSNTWWPRTPC